MMISRVLTAACVAGFLTAVVVTTLQIFATTPLILKAETFEKQTSVKAAGKKVLSLTHKHQAPTPEALTDADPAEWHPTEGLPRAALTGLATLVSGVGYALLLAALLLAARSDLSIGQTLTWAVGGFLAVNLAPAAGSPPELPGMGGEHLGARQVWWLATVTSTSLGLYLIAIVRAPWAIALGFAATLVPHIVGAPHGAAAASEVPPALAAQFAARSLVIAFVFWVVLGLSLSWTWRRLATTAETEAAAI
jgi:cobalt transporter subunit CbtA